MKKNNVTKTQKAKTTAKSKTVKSTGKSKSVRETYRLLVAQQKSAKPNREEQLKSLFGPSNDGIPTESLTYIRKNPKRFVKKITDIYGKDSVVKWANNK